ncbi:hypoxanthine phosphoribosyltransferase [Afifella marina]|uniref:Hypoxanthine phosphoribosyltransferase n=1 Tax=Afifella marina DSM 2698 TaxID=1120955 RepID=A0A1G5NQZ2_AFIMA|nr:hypoxanthine phosphoribosyltransferase [Afifella marina]MBK1624760.1 hypoxanthine phosphoribosyltransferase [Afifella marina DSM 2698]MBK1628572.1 hypoxanthine phosphoribosyltransferase [Afifella marina]MBK5915931.1 hypoxanthine phosphoribosyltransferase [Afifella marina]RAI20534.1 hypoxanthine phosphoribosyltransferase [Afifella marina DSM 2698]SCZ39807.1 hypoxanthine phosphoribosyltransferase [Afifella marina DSM 2698]
MTPITTAHIRPLFSAEEIDRRINELAEAICATNPEGLLAIIVLKGGFVFGADLARAMSRRGVTMEIEFISLSSYGARLKTSGEVRILRDIGCPVAGRDVLIIDDVLDSGLTVRFARELMATRGARRVQVAVMIDKPEGRKAEIEADYVGFTCPDYFVVGYGMDAGHAHRELPFVGVVESDEEGAN